MSKKTKTTKKHKPKVTKKEAQKYWYPSRNDKRYDFKEE